MITRLKKSVHYRRNNTCGNCTKWVIKVTERKLRHMLRLVNVSILGMRTENIDSVFSELVSRLQ